MLRFLKMTLFEVTVRVQDQLKIITGLEVLALKPGKWKPVPSISRDRPGLCEVILHGDQTCSAMRSRPFEQDAGYCNLPREKYEVRCTVLQIIRLVADSKNRFWFD